MGIKTWLGLKKKRVPIEKAPFYNVNSHSQIQQDRWVLGELSNKSNGYFVEVGAFDGKSLSNTYLLEKEFGWTGILAEPNPAQHQAIRSVRSASVDTRPVDGISGRSVLMRFMEGEPELSSMATNAYSDQHAENRKHEAVEIDQTTVSLNDLLEEHGAPTDIDYISIDTEGNELDILSTFDFGKYNVRLFSVEHNYTSADGKIEEFLVGKGYERVCREWSRFDGWYRKRLV